MNPVILSKIRLLTSDYLFVVANKKLQEAEFDEKSKLYSLLKEYAIYCYRNENSSLIEIPMKIQELYKTDDKVKRFFDSIPCNI